MTWKPTYISTRENPDGKVDMHQINTGEGDDLATVVTLGVPHGDNGTPLKVCLAYNLFVEGASNIDTGVVTALDGLMRAPWYPCARRRQALLRARIALHVAREAKAALDVEVKLDQRRLQWYRNALFQLREIAQRFGVDRNLGWKEWKAAIEARLAAP
jgi:hypothetical protein